MFFFLRLGKFLIIFSNTDALGSPVNQILTLAGLQIIVLVYEVLGIRLKNLLS